MRLLILDDEVLSVEIMLAQVNWEKCGVDDVLVAYNVEDAKELIKENEIDLALCDIEMPGENGIEFVQWLREQENQMVCIFLTCHAKFEYAQEAVRLGSMDYLLLPTPYEVIEEKIQNAVLCIRARQKEHEMMRLGKEWVKDQTEYLEEQYGQARNKDVLLAEAERYIRENIDNVELSVHKVTDYLCMNVDYFSKLFRNEKNITLNRYIIQTRMNLAKVLLSEGNLSPAVVAGRVGYDNYSYFSTSFKKVYGISPASYIKIYNKKPEIE